MKSKKYAYKNCWSQITNEVTWPLDYQSTIIALQWYMKRSAYLVDDSDLEDEMNEDE